MVTKLKRMIASFITCLILAKNHMVTKQFKTFIVNEQGLILAKNHMVTKHLFKMSKMSLRLILAKNHMVTKRSLQ